MNELTLDLWVGEVLAAQVTSSERTPTTLTYTPDYAGTPVSLSMPIIVGEHRGVRVDNWLRGLLPDNPQAISSLRRHHRVPGSKPLSLLEALGADVPGAVAFTKPGESLPDGSLQPLTDDDVAQLLQEAKDRYLNGTAYNDPVRVSIPGAQPKLGLTKLPEGGWALPTGLAPSTHIFKPDPEYRFNRLDIREQMAMRAARYLGLNVADSELVNIAGVNVYVTERYDRKVDGGVIRRVHQEDLLQALAGNPAKKYQSEGGPGILSISSLLKSFPNSTDARDTGFALFQGFMFNFLSRNSDAHMKNYALLLDGTGVTLAPLYDLMSTAGMNVPQEFAFRIGDINAYEHLGLDAVKYLGSLFLVDEALAEEETLRIQRGLVGAFEMARTVITERLPQSEVLTGEILATIETFPALPATSLVSPTP